MCTYWFCRLACYWTLKNTILPKRPKNSSRASGLVVVPRPKSVSSFFTISVCDYATLWTCFWLSEPPLSGAWNSFRRDGLALSVKDLTLEFFADTSAAFLAVSSGGPSPGHIAMRFRALPLMLLSRRSLLEWFSALCKFFGFGLYTAARACIC